MGSLLGLGIKRSVLGNIYCNENDIEFEILDSIEKYVLDNFCKIGSKTIEITKLNRPIKEKEKLTKYTQMMEQVETRLKQLTK